MFGTGLFAPIYQRLTSNGLIRASFKAAGNDEVAKLRVELEAVRAELETVKANVRYSVNREVCLCRHADFVLYQYNDDWASKSMLADERWRHLVGVTLDEAHSCVEAAIEKRSRHKIDSMAAVRDHWSSPDVHHYNAIHRGILACLSAAGRDASFIDIGGNTGDTALFAADTLIRLGSQSHVWCFEPGPIFELARASVWLNRLSDRIEVINAAASEHDGFTPMRIMVGHSESGSIAGIDQHYPDLPVGETRMVKTIRLDTYFANRPERQLYLKIDAEGHDFSVVRGAKNLIADGRVPALHMEITPKYMREQDRALLADLCSRYRLYNLRTIDVAGSFDRFQPIAAAEIPAFLDRAATFHGWVDAALIDIDFAQSEPFKLLARTHPVDGAKDAEPALAAP